MTLYERLILLSEKVNLIIFKRERMTLSAKAQEVARIQGRKSCIYSWIINMVFWYDPNHCQKAYAYYRLLRKRRNRNMRLKKE